MRKLFLASLAVLNACLISFAEIRMNPLFTDNMVLQQRTEVPVWGTASPGSVVSVVWNRHTYQTQADSDGKWMLKVRTPKAGGPYEMIVSDGELVTISNILVGEVWLCSGQSNMEMPVKGWGKVKDYEKELKEADRYPQIRLMQVRRVTSPKPLDDFEADGGGWQVCSSESLEKFSATAYFFAREIHLNERVPVGVINSSWGGTVIEAWMSADALEGVSRLEEDAKVISTYPISKKDRAELYKRQVKEWDEAVRQLDRGFSEGNPVWASCGYDDSQWAGMAVPCQIESHVPGYNGLFWMRKEVDIPAEWEGKELTLSLCAVDDWDYTYFNGTLIGKGYGWNVRRTYKVPAENVHAGKAVVTVRCLDTGGEGGIYGKKDRTFLEGPDGRKISLEGEWSWCSSRDYSQLPERPTDTSSNPNRPTLLYNAMINPLVPFAIKGAIWYQGCANVDRAYQYRELLPLMIGDWRQAWGCDFPFHIAQLANFKDRQTVPGESDWAELREAQMMTAETVRGAGLAVLIDIGEAKDIHPKNKQEVGRRLALHALANEYGHKVDAEGPKLERYEIQGDSIRLFFSNVGKGLAVQGSDRLEGFALAGADRKFHWADAVIEGNTVVVRSQDVARPLAVRYAWAANPLGNLYNSAGLPASPFRTDEWPGLTFGRN